MSMINFAKKELSCKIVYVGPGLGGKTKNVETIYRMIPAPLRKDLTNLSTDNERTLFFDFLPLDVGTLGGYKTKLQLYTVPGQRYYSARRKLILKGVDGIVFVADRQMDRRDANLEAMQSLYDQMQEHGVDMTKLPLVLQYNKRDLPDALPIATLEEQLNPGWAVDTLPPGFKSIEEAQSLRIPIEPLEEGGFFLRAPHMEAIATAREGVMETLKLITKLALKHIAAEKKLATE